MLPIWRCAGREEKCSSLVAERRRRPGLGPDPERHLLQPGARARRQHHLRGHGRQPHDGGEGPARAIGSATLTVGVSDGEERGRTTVAVKVAGSGDNTLDGGARASVLLGRDGDDKLRGDGGTDVLCGRGRAKERGRGRLLRGRARNGRCHRLRPGPGRQADRHPLTPGPELLPRSRWRAPSVASCRG